MTCLIMKELAQVDQKTKNLGMIDLFWKKDLFLTIFICEIQFYPKY